MSGKSLGQLVDMKNYNALGTIEFVITTLIDREDKIIIIKYHVGNKDFDIPVDLETLTQELHEYSIDHREKDVASQVSTKQE